MSNNSGKMSRGYLALFIGLTLVFVHQGQYGIGVQTFAMLVLLWVFSSAAHIVMGAFITTLVLQAAGRLVGALGIWPYGYGNIGGVLVGVVLVGIVVYLANRCVSESEADTYLKTDFPERVDTYAKFRKDRSNR